MDHSYEVLANKRTESIESLERTYGWSITSAASSPPTVTMTYKSQLQLFFHPAAFASNAKSNNKPISLTYTPNQQLSTTLRFFLQLLRAALQALPQSSTRVADLLALVSGGWDTALSVREAERRLHLEGMTESRIVSDERLCISSRLLLPKVRTKVRVSFDVGASVSVNEGESMELSTSVEPSVKVVYGEQYNDKKMTEFLQKEVGNGIEGWDGAVRELRERLLARGVKGGKR